MKNEIIKIAKDLEQDTVTVEQAQNLLLGLFDVSGSYLIAVKEFGLFLDYTSKNDGRQFLDIMTEGEDGRKHVEACKYSDGTFNYR